MKKPRPPARRDEQTADSYSGRYFGDNNKSFDGAEKLRVLGNKRVSNNLLKNISIHR